MTLFNKQNTNVTNIEIELLGKPIHSLKNELNDIFCNAISTITYHLRDWLKKPDITLDMCDIELNMDNSSDIFSPASILKHSDGGNIHGRMPAELLMLLSDGFYSADIVRTLSTNKGVEDIITSSDLRLQNRLVKLFASFIAPENMWQSTEDATYGEMSLRVEFVLSVQDASGTFRLELDDTLVGNLIDKLNLLPSLPSQEQFTQVLTKTPVKLNTILCRKVLPLDQVLTLKADDIIHIELLSNMPVSIGQECLFNGHIAEQNGQLVLILKD